MNKHLNDGQLRASLDHELAEIDQWHLDSCASCQARQKQIRNEALSAQERLSFLTIPGQEAGRTPRNALQNFFQRYAIQKEKSMFKKLYASPILKIGLAIAVIIAIVISIPATRAFAGQLLSLFRVQQVVVVPVDFTGMEQLTGNGALGKELSQLVSSSVTTLQSPGDPVTVSDASQASQLTGFTVRLPEGLTPSRISVENSSAFSFQLDIAKAQALLDESGRSDLVLPSSLNGVDISVSIPASVSVAYGNCPEPGQDSSGGISLNGSAGRRYNDCVILAEIPSPSVSAPADVNVAQLAQIGLEFTGMSPDQAAAFTNSVDWTSSLVIPIPKNAATYQQVQVDGVTGTLIQRPADDAPQYVLLWVKDGIIYAIGSLGSGSQQAIQMANSLP